MFSVLVIPLIYVIACKNLGELRKHSDCSQIFVHFRKQIIIIGSRNT